MEVGFTFARVPGKPGIPGTVSSVQNPTMLLRIKRIESDYKMEKKMGEEHHFLGRNNSVLPKFE